MKQNRANQINRTKEVVAAFLIVVAVVFMTIEPAHAAQKIEPTFMDWVAKTWGSLWGDGCECRSIDQ